MERSSERADDRSGGRRLVLNPTSGRGGHVDDARRLARDHGFDVVETEYGGHAAELTRAAVADGVRSIAVCGGDGTLHEVVAGLYAVDALDDVTVSVIPAGTENFVAGELGVDSLREGFAVATDGEVRRIDLGVADGEPFVLSAIMGYPAETSQAASHDLKHEYGPAAFLIAGIEEGLSYDGLSVRIDALGPDGERTWAGDALAVLVGNLRKFAKGGGQADVEDGHLEVAVVESMPLHDAVLEAVEQRVLHDDTAHVEEFRATEFDVVVDGDPAACSLDGETSDVDRVHFDVLPSALAVAVGPDYEPDPES